MASQSAGQGGSLPSHLRYKGARSPEDHFAWCREFNRYMHTAAPIAWQMMNGELAEPEARSTPGDGSAPAAVTSSGDEDSSTTCTSSSDTDSGIDHAAQSVKLEREEESRAQQDQPNAPAAQTTTAGATAHENAVGQDQLDAPAAQITTAGATADESAVGDAEAMSGGGKPRDDIGRFTATAAGTPPAGAEQKEMPLPETDEERAAREKREAFDAGRESMANAAASARKSKRVARRARHKARKREARKTERGTSKKKKASSVKTLVRQAKDVLALSRSLITALAYGSLSRALRVALWSHNSNIIWGCLRAALGDEHSFLIARMTTRDGVNAWAIVNRRHSESSAASETHYLQLFLTQKLEKSAKGGEQPSMGSYFEKLSELAELYSQSRVDKGTIKEHLWRMKALDLPPYYSDAVTALEIADAEARSRGEPVRSSSAIADYVTDFEVRRRRKRELRIAESGGQHRHYSSTHRSDRDLHYCGLLTEARQALIDARIEALAICEERALTKKELAELFVKENQVQQLLEAQAEDAESRDSSDNTTAAKLDLEGYGSTHELGYTSATTHQNASQWDTYDNRCPDTTGETTDEDVDEGAAGHEQVAGDFYDDSGSSQEHQYQDMEYEQYARHPARAYPSCDQEGSSDNALDGGGYIHDGSSSNTEEANDNEHMYYDHGFVEEHEKDAEEQWEDEYWPDELDEFGEVTYADTYTHDEERISA